MAGRPQEVSREQVLRVAGGLFYRHGIRATGVAEVIAAAGCGKAALYRLFPSKDELVAAYLEGRAAERRRCTDEAVRAAGDDPAGQLVALVGELADWVGRPGYRGCAVRNYLREHPAGAGPATRVAEAFLRESEDRVGRLAASARPGGGADVARKVWLVHEGLYASHHPTPEARAAAVDLVSALVRPGRDTAGSLP